MSEEIWKEIKEYSSYEISNYGNVRNKKSKKILTIQKRGGYSSISLHNNSKTISKLIHRLVAETFIPNLDNKPTVNHIDKNTYNNMVENLEWNTYKENATHKFQTIEKKEFGMGCGKRSILRLNKDTNEKIEEYESITLAVKWLFDNNLIKSNELNADIVKSQINKIRRVITGKRLKYCNFKWCYKDAEILENEQWKPINPLLINNITGFHVSSLGRIKSAKNRITKGFIDNFGYNLINIQNKSVRIHRIVAQTFIPNPDNKPQINHKDKNKLNNAISNLEWTTSQENNLHKTTNLVNNKQIKKIIQYDLNMKKLAEFNSQKEAADTLKINNKHINACCRGKCKTTHGFIFKYSLVPV